MTTAELEARNLSLGELIMLLPEVKNESALPSDILAREIGYRLMAASKIASILEDSLFYARMFKDSSDDGRARREEMIDDAVDLISLFRNGGIYP